LAQSPPTWAISSRPLEPRRATTAPSGCSP
jgi:hypothetical protein